MFASCNNCMNNIVVDSIARKYEHVRKRDGDVMGGIILDTQAKRILNQGREEGRAEGREEGRAEGREEGRTEGREEGRTEGRREGIDIGEDRMGALYVYLDDLCRLDEYKAAVFDPEFRRKLYEEMDQSNNN